MPDGASPADPTPCLVLHGLGGGPYELAPLIEALAESGIRVSAPILPGHEGPGPVMPASRWQDWAATAEAAYEELTGSSGPVDVLGFSTGATLAMLLAARRPVRRLVLLAPFMAIRLSWLVPFHPSRYLRPIGRVIPDLPRRPPAVRDRDARRLLAGSANFRTFSIAATLSALEVIDEVTPSLGSITSDVLILQGKLDTVVEPRGAARLLQALGATRKRLIMLDRSDHLLAFDRDRDRVRSETLAFLLGP